MDIDLVIEAVFNRPAIWDKRHTQHSNRLVVDKYWKQVAVELQYDEIAIRKKWKYLREKFSVECAKEMRGPWGGGGDETAAAASRRSYRPSTRSKWVFYQQLMFLKDIVTPRISAGSINKKSRAVSSLSFSNCTAEEIEETEQGLIGSDYDYYDDQDHKFSLKDDGPPAQDEVSDYSQSQSQPAECMEDDNTNNTNNNIVRQDNDNTRSRTTAASASISSEEEEEEEEEEESTFIAPLSLSSSRNHNKRKRKALEYQKSQSKLLELELKLEERKIQYLMKIPRRGAAEKEKEAGNGDSDSDLMFYKALLCHVRLIPQEKKLHYQGEIQAVVQKYAYPDPPPPSSSKPSESLGRMSPELVSYCPTSPSQSPSAPRKYQ